MAYLIDSDVVIDHLADDPWALQLLDELAPAGLSISMITYMEVSQGILVGPNPTRAQSKFDVFLSEVRIAPFSSAVALRCARLRIQLQQQHRRVRPRALDLLNAATALEYQLTLVTRNLADYDDIAELSIYDFHEE